MRARRLVGVAALAIVAVGCRGDGGRAEEVVTPARTRAIVADAFERPSADTLGVTQTGQRWIVDPQSTWGIRDGAAMLLDAPQDARAEAVVDAGTADAIGIEADVTLSPTPFRGNAGITYRYGDHANYLWSKLEVSEGHPGGMVTIGKVSDGTTVSLLAHVDDIGIVNGATYHVRVDLDDDLVTVTVSGGGIGEAVSVSYRLTPEEMQRYGDNRLVGLRGRLAFDEDDGLTRWERFSVEPGG